MSRSLGNVSGDHPHRMVLSLKSMGLYGPPLKLNVNWFVYVFCWERIRRFHHCQRTHEHKG